MIYITGDNHGTHDYCDVGTKAFPEQKELTKSDYVIIAGDIAVVWSGDNKDNYCKNWYNSRNFTTLFVDGNHENHDLLDTYPVSEWNGGKVHFISDSIIHLMRGQVFEIDGIKIFTFGGASSWDRQKVNGRGWWTREEPSEAEYEEALINLSKHNNTVDYIITHTCSKELTKQMLDDKGSSKINDFFDTLETSVSFKNWYFGHYHQDTILDNKHRLLYHDVIKLGE